VTDTYTKWNYEKILVLTKDGPNRQSIAKSLQQAGFTVDFVSAINDVVEALNRFGSGIFIHDFEATDKGQGELLQQRLNRLDEYAPVIRVVLALEITPKLMALASDAQVKRLVPYSSNLASIGQELKMVTKTESSVGEMQRKIRGLASSTGKNSQIEADKIIEETYLQYRHDPAIRIEFGGVLIRREQYDEAKTIAEQILKKEPQNLRAMSLTSRALMKQGKLKEAIAIMENANTLAPGNTERLMTLGDAFYKTGQTEKAKSYLRQARDSDPSAAGDVDKQLGQIALDEGDMSAALDLFVGSCTEDESAGYFNNSAVMATKAGKPEHALELYQTALKALKTNRLKPAVYYNIALTYCDLELYKDALKAVNNALKIDKKFEKAVRLKERIDRESDESKKIKKTS
jgi:tetratricopeptide (TPR) repeat protein/CheY-like chemotaxis protein